jgi:hypothetical protein
MEILAQVMRMAMHLLLLVEALMTMVVRVTSQLATSVLNQPKLPLLLVIGVLQLEAVAAGKPLIPCFPTDVWLGTSGDK